MSNIVAGRFQLQAQADGAIAALQAAGFAPQQVTSFFVNPPGQHDLYALGGDADNSPGAYNAPAGATHGAEAGGAIGAVVGLASLPVLGPAGPLLGAGVGAYVGALAGALSSLGHPVDPGAEGATAKADLEHAPLRKSGMLVAVATDARMPEAEAVRVLRAQGAAEIERAEGTIVDGHWPDFDPLKPNLRIDAAPPGSDALPVER